MVPTFARNGAVQRRSGRYASKVDRSNSSETPARASDGRRWADVCSRPAEPSAQRPACHRAGTARRGPLRFAAQRTGARYDPNIHRWSADVNRAGTGAVVSGPRLSQRSSLGSGGGDCGWPRVRSGTPARRSSAESDQRPVTGSAGFDTGHEPPDHGRDQRCVLHRGHRRRGGRRPSTTVPGSRLISAAHGTIPSPPSHQTFQRRGPTISHPMRQTPTSRAPPSFPKPTPSSEHGRPHGLAAAIAASILTAGAVLWLVARRPREV